MFFGNIERTRKIMDSLRDMLQRGSLRSPRKLVGWFIFSIFWGNVERTRRNGFSTIIFFSWTI
jgi:hypothetical protein